MRATAAAVALGALLAAGAARAQDGGAAGGGAPPAPAPAKEEPAKAASPALEKARAQVKEAEALAAAGRFGDAIPVLEEAHGALLSNVGECLESAAAQSALGVAYYAVGRIPEALRVHAECLSVLRKVTPGDDVDLAQALSNSACAQFAAGNFEVTRAQFEESLAIRKRVFPGDHPLTADAMAQLGNTLIRLGRFEEALVHCMAATDMFRRVRGPDHLDVAYALGCTTTAQKEAGRLAEARASIEAALAVYGRAGVGDHLEVAQALDSYGSILSALGRPAECLAKKQEALAMWRRCLQGDHPQIASGLFGVAYALDNCGRSHEALPLFEDYLAMNRRLFRGDHPALAQGRNALGYTLGRMGRHEEAVPHFQEAVAMATRLLAPGHPQLNTYRNNLAYGLARVGRWSESIALYRQVVESQRAWPGGAGSDVGLTLMNLAAELYATGQVDEAAPVNDEAIRELRLQFGPDHGYLVCALATQGWILEFRGDAGAAIACHREAVAMADRIQWADRHRAVVSLGVTLLRNGKAAEAEAHLRAAVELVESRVGSFGGLAVEEEAAFRNEVRDSDPFPGLVRALRARKETNEAFAFLERGRGQTVLRLLLRGRGDAVAAAGAGLRAARDPAIVERISAARRASADAESEVVQREQAEERARGTKRADAVKLAAAGTAEARKALLAAHSAEARLLREALPETRPATVEEMAATLGEGERLVSLQFDADGGLAFLLGPAAKGRPPAVRSFELKDGDRALTASLLESLVPAALAGLSKPGASDARALASLFGALFPPDLWKEVRGARTLFVVGDGATHALPFEALVVGEKDGKPVYWLDEGPPVAYAASGSVLALLRSRRDAQDAGAKGPPSLVALGDAEFGSGKEVASAGLRGGALKRGDLAPLPGTRAEVEGIRRVFAERKAPATVLLGKEATEKRLHDAAGTGPRYLHLATHGVADETESASFSHLALSMPSVPVPGDDGALTLLDLLGKWGRRLEGTGMVVLSACDTQKGRIARHEGIVALPWGFHFAGCPTVVATLWKVSDATTPPLMEGFYRELLGREGKGRLEALVAAKKALRKSHPDPFHWAPFVLLGDPR